MSIEFDNVDDVMTNTVLTGGITTEFSCSLWMYAGSDGGAVSAWLYQGRNYIQQKSQVLLRDELSGAMNIAFNHRQTGSTNKKAITSDRPASINMWHNVICLAKRNVAMEVYVDGVEATSYSQQDIPLVGLEDFDEIYVGNISAGNRSFDGKISELALWKSFLDASEIAMLQSGVKRMPLQVDPANLLDYWPLDDRGDGTTADSKTHLDMVASHLLTGDHGGNASGLIGYAEEVLSY